MPWGNFSNALECLRTTRGCAGLPKLHPLFCIGCLQVVTATYECLRCGVPYCSKECQMRDHARHGPHCVRQKSSANILMHFLQYCKSATRQSQPHLAVIPNHPTEKCVMFFFVMSGDWSASAAKREVVEQCVTSLVEDSNAVYDHVVVIVFRVCVHAQMPYPDATYSEHWNRFCDRPHCKKCGLNRWINKAAGYIDRFKDRHCPDPQPCYDYVFVHGDVVYAEIMRGLEARARGAH